MAYNIGEKPEKGRYVCPNCGCGVGEMTMLARREGTSVGREAPAILVGARHHPNNVKSLKPHFAKLALILILAGLMFTSGFVAKTLLLREPPVVSSDNPSPGNSNLPLSAGNERVEPSGASVSSGNPSVIVWVNTSSGVYHCPNTQWYGSTKSGKYMTQKEAQSRGYRPAHASVCG